MNATDLENIKKQLEAFKKAEGSESKSYEEEKKSFPTPSWAKGIESLTKRELLAAMAMQGISANSNAELTLKQIAKLAVNQADALLEELSK